eukprot:PhM_4_TR1340/c1_g1_i2/m.96534
MLSSPSSPPRGNTIPNRCPSFRRAEMYLSNRMEKTQDRFRRQLKKANVRDIVPKKSDDFVIDDDGDDDDEYDKNNLSARQPTRWDKVNEKALVRKPFAGVIGAITSRYIKQRMTRLRDEFPGKLAAQAAAEVAEFTAEEDRARGCLVVEEEDEMDVIMSSIAISSNKSNGTTSSGWDGAVVCCPSTGGGGDDSSSGLVQMKVTCYDGVDDDLLMTIRVGNENNYADEEKEEEASKKRGIKNFVALNKQNITPRFNREIIATQRKEERRAEAELEARYRYTEAVVMSRPMSTRILVAQQKTWLTFIMLVNAARQFKRLERRVSRMLTFNEKFTHNALKRGSKTQEPLGHHRHSRLSHVLFAMEDTMSFPRNTPPDGTHMKNNSSGGLTPINIGPAGGYPTRHRTNVSAKRLS